jgi:hypothetical protein
MWMISHVCGVMRTNQFETLCAKPCIAMWALILNLSLKTGCGKGALTRNICTSTILRLQSLWKLKNDICF